MDLLRGLLLGLDEARESEAAGWVVLVIDTEIDEPISVYGPCGSPEAALLLAGEFDRDEHTGIAPADGTPGWRHLILPIFEPST
jgi:hypothetical protein